MTRQSPTTSCGTASPTVVPLSKTSPEQIEQIRAWGRERAVPASGVPIGGATNQKPGRRGNGGARRSVAACMLVRAQFACQRRSACVHAVAPDDGLASAGATSAAATPPSVLRLLDRGPILSWRTSCLLPRRGQDNHRAFGRARSVPADAEQCETEIDCRGGKCDQAGVGSRCRVASSRRSTGSRTSTEANRTRGGTWSRCRTQASRPT